VPKKPQSNFAALVTLAVGNTRTRAYRWNARGQSRLLWALATERVTRAALKKLARLAPVALTGVVPAALLRLRRDLHRSGARVLVFRENLACALRIAPRPPERVGSDRLAAALGALSLAKTPWVVIDAGTALTVNAVRPGVFLGGLIVPGEALSLRALGGGTAQLPVLLPWGAGKVPAVGRSTQEAIRAGVRRAIVAAAVDLTRAQLRVLGPRARIVVTGGGAKVLLPELKRAFAKHKPLLVEDLVHRGLFAAWQGARR